MGVVVLHGGHNQFEKRYARRFVRISDSKVRFTIATEGYAEWWGRIRKRRPYRKLRKAGQGAASPESVR